MFLEKIFIHVLNSTDKSLDLKSIKTNFFDYLF